MYGHIGNEFSYNNLGHFPLPDITSTTTEPLILPHLTIPSNNLDSLSAFKSDSSGCSSYIGSPASITSYGTHTSTLIQRSISSHSLQKNYEGYSQLDSSPVRKVLSTGDLQGINLAQHNQRFNSPLSNDSSIIIESMNKPCRYSPEEKKERIERYRSKRNLRNFNKRIKYECRKTLADSRPRIRGRFARNDETEKTTQSHYDHAGIEEDEEDDDNWINIINAFSANLMP
ncbi:zinc finger protein HD1-like [Olea europaea var. sylvestris]|uniref:Two-component response regulator-like APRR5 n=1 Tax=Olea europaea subsp. europaea TaxID=158383 RepID=A0A8S0RR56_OLEEU|nr:zinc finger protein HD1-like [Olea europaea var. sylvestris]CAA2982412.1 two-component response regulator-like APRR5 [Olea europaea subsp. europaea]